MFNQKIFRLVILNLVVLSFLIFSFPCNSTANEIPIGLLLPYTGSWGWIGAAESGARLAVKEINDDGGIITKDGKHHKITLYIADTETKSSSAIAAARKLYEINKIVALIGPSSATIRSVIPITKEMNAVEISPTAGTTALDTIGGCINNECIFRSVSSDIVMGSGMMFQAKKLGAKKVAFFFADNEGARSILGVLKDAAKVTGMEVSGEVLFPMGQISYRSELRKILKNNPDVIFFESGPETAAIHFKNWYEMNLKGVWIGTDFVNDKFVTSTAPASNGTYAVNPGPILDDRFKKWLGDYKKVTGKKGLDQFAINAYDAMNIIALALEKAGEISRISPKNTIRLVTNPPGNNCYNFPECAQLLRDGKEIDYTGIAGPQDLNEYGDPTTFLKVEVIKNGKITRIGTITQDEIDEIIKGVINIRTNR